MTSTVPSASASQSASTLAPPIEIMTKAPTSTQSSPPPTAPATPQTPSLLARYTCAGISCAIFSIWFQLTFQLSTSTDDLSLLPNKSHAIHSYHAPLLLTVSYLASLPLLKYIVQTHLAPNYDIRAYLKESMVLYNIAQVALNGWMVYRFVDAVVYRGHPFVGDINTTGTGTDFVIWVHYCDKYLEFFDTYFMVLRGRMDQVSFLHVYHHFSITWAWYAAINLFPGGDSYFGALLNSLIHVLMYSYYALALLKIPCPWKRFLTQAQLLQFATVVVYSVVSVCSWEREEREWRHLACIGIQVWEMGSLFVLFGFFYRRSYGKGKVVEGVGSSPSSPMVELLKEAADGTTVGSEGGATAAEDDQCQVAVRAAVKGAAQVVESAAMDVGKAGSRVVQVVAASKKGGKSGTAGMGRQTVW